MKSEGAGSFSSVQNILPAALEAVAGAAETTDPNTVAATTVPRMVQSENIAIASCEGFVPPLNFQELPPDTLGMVFQLLTTDPNFSRALTSLSRTGKEFNRLIVEFVNSYGINPEVASVKSAQREVWKAQSGFIKENIEKVRTDFERSQQILSGMAAAGSNSSSAVSMTDSARLNELDGVEFRLQDRQIDPAAIAGLLSKLEGKVIKLDAKGIGRDRFLNEVLPALKAVNPGCQIVLDASENQLGVDDLKVLLDYMSTNPRIYRLDLSGNSLCRGSDFSPEMLQLFEFAGPLTHLSLSGTGLNDATAAGLNKAIAGAPLLARLDLSDNSLTEEGAIAVMTAIAPGSETGQPAITTIRQVRLADNAYEQSPRLQNACRQASLHLYIAGKTDPEISKHGYKDLSPLYMFFQDAVFDLGKSSAKGARVDGRSLFIRGCHYELDEADAL